MIAARSCFRRATSREFHHDVHHPAGCRVHARLRARRACGRAGLSDQEHHADRAVRGRRADRRDLAHHRRAHVAHARPPADHRERRRRRRHHRLDPRQARRAGWLHHHHRPHGHACGLGRALSEAAIRPAHRFRADRPDRRHADPHSGQEGLPREGPQRVRRAREEEREDAQRRACRCRLGVVHHLPAAQLDHGREADPSRSTAPARR